MIIARVSMSDGMIETIAGTGTACGTSSNGALTSTMISPSSLWVSNSDGVVYFADSNGQLIRRIASMEFPTSMPSSQPTPPTVAPTKASKLTILRTRVGTGAPAIMKISCLLY